MNELERAIGRLEGKFDALTTFEEKEHGGITKRFDVMEKKLDDLMRWKWKFTGGSLVVLAIVTYLFK